MPERLNLRNIILKDLGRQEAPRKQKAESPLTAENSHGHPWNNGSGAGVERDLPCDGEPDKRSFVNRQGLRIQTYCWKPAQAKINRDIAPRAIVAILHGARTHTRLSWLSKQPSHPAYTPRYCASDYIIKDDSHRHRDSASRRVVQPADSCSLSTVASESRLSAGGGSLEFSRQPTGSSTASSMDHIPSTSPDDSCCLPSSVELDKEDRFRQFSSSSGSLLYSAASSSSIEDLDDAATAAEESLQRIASEEEHSHKDHYPIYSGSWIEAFVESNLWVYGCDLQGHGCSEGWRGLRCTFREFDDLTEDLIQFLEMVRSDHPDVVSTPLIVIGVSLSGPVVVRMLEDPRCSCLGISGAVILAGLLCRPIQYTPKSMKVIIKAVGLAGKVMPRLPLLGTALPDKKDEDWQGEIGARDPYLYRGNFTAHAFSTTLTALDQLDRDLPKLLELRGTSRIYFIHNWTDPINPAYFSIRLAHRLIDLQREREEISCGDGFTRFKKEVGREIAVKCTLLNYPVEEAEESPVAGNSAAASTWSPTAYRDTPPLPPLNSAGFDLDTTPLQVDHTLTSDIDNGYVFKLVFQWIQQEVLEV